jgi:hypothetical protein
LFQSGHFLAACVHFSALINRQRLVGGDSDVKTVSNRCASAAKAGLSGVALKDGQVTASTPKCLEKLGESA